MRIFTTILRQYLIVCLWARFVGTFIENVTKEDPEAKIQKTSEVYELYVRWCEDNKYEPVDGKLVNVVYGIAAKSSNEQGSPKGDDI